MTSRCTHRHAPDGSTRSIHPRCSASPIPPSPAGERMAVKLVRDQIRQRHHPERGDIPHHTIDPFLDVPARVLRVRLAPMAMACRVPIAARVTIGSRPRRLDITSDIHGAQTAPR